LVGCPEWETGGNIGGANQGLRAPGNRQGGLSLGEGDVAVSPDGKFFAAIKGGKLVLGDVGGDSSRSPGLPKPERVAFWATPDGEGILVLANGKRDGNGVERLVAYDRKADKVLWDVELPRGDRWLDVTPDGRRVILASATSAVLVDGTSGAVLANLGADTFNIRDVDVTKDGRHVIVTRDMGFAMTDVTMTRTEDGTDVCTVDANNCADEIVLSSDETRAFLSPTLCNEDPVTVIRLSDTGDCAVEKQMPGFGPVALSPDGKTAVAFLDRDAVDPTGVLLPADVQASNTRYHLMFIDTDSLTFTSKPHGDQLPRYTFTPDGSSLIVDVPMDLMAKVEVVDPRTFSRRAVSGPPVKLHVFSFSPDSATAFVIDAGLFELDVGGAKLSPIPLAFPPSNLNITPDGMTLLVTNKLRSTVHFVDARTRLETGRVTF
jgi:dipeptidyl aminopeptidase/acylaminoacyl peptidase